MISLGHAARIYAGLTWKRMRRGKLLWFCALLVAVPVVGAAGLALAGSWGRGLFDDTMDLYFRFLLPFVPALLASPVVAEEIEQKTFTFLFARPAPRAALVLGKFLAVTLPLVAAVALSVALIWLCAMARFPGDMAENLGHLLVVEAAALLGALAFAALASLVGSLFTGHPFVAVALYLLLVEAGLGSTPLLLSLVAISWHLRNLSGLLTPSLFSFFTVHVPGWVSALIALGVTIASLGGAIGLIEGAEYQGR